MNEKSRLESRFGSNYIVPAETMEKIDRALKFYATHGSWHYSDREMRAPPRACSEMDRRPQAHIDGGKFAGEVYAELVKLYPLEQSAASENRPKDRLLTLDERLQKGIDKTAPKDPRPWIDRLRDDVAAPSSERAQEDQATVPYFPTWQMKEAGGEFYLQCQELHGSKMGTTAMDIAAGIWSVMLKAAPVAPASANVAPLGTETCALCEGTGWVRQLGGSGA